MLAKIVRIIKYLKGKEIFYPIQLKKPKEFHGNNSGGWTICPENLNQDSIVLSFGVGTDVTFDMSLINKYNLTVYAFDPTPKCIEWVKNQKLTKDFKFFPYGLSNFDGMASFMPPENPNFVSYHVDTNGDVKCLVKKFDTIMTELNLKKVDVLKMDIEGSEYEVIEDLLNSDIPVTQILIEFHHRMFGIEKTKRAIKSLNYKGYKIFSISDSGYEYSFIKEL